MAKNVQIVERVNDLNGHQWNLYNWLSSKEKLVSLKDIYHAFDNYYPDYKKEKTTWNNSVARRQITDDLNALANSQCLYKVLIRSVNGVGYLPKEETEKFLLNECYRLSREWKTLRNQLNKARLNNQARLVFGNEKEIIEAFKQEV